MKKQIPYLKIINLSEELEEYKKLCNLKSEKYTYYLDWKDHILQKLSALDTSKKRENFKHYLINNKRNNKNYNSYFLPLLVFCVNPLINYLIQGFSICSLITNIIIIMLISFIFIFSYEDNNKEYYFYCDLIEILEEIEKKEAAKYLTLTQTTNKL